MMPVYEVWRCRDGSYCIIEKGAPPGEYPPDMTLLGEGGIEECQELVLRARQAEQCYCAGSGACGKNGGD